MPKEKVYLGTRIMNWVISHPWLKLVALVLAILVWFYVKGEINRVN